MSSLVFLCFCFCSYSIIILYSCCSMQRLFRFLILDSAISSIYSLLEASVVQSILVISLLHRVVCNRFSLRAKIILRIIRPLSLRKAMETAASGTPAWQPLCASPPGRSEPLVNRRSHICARESIKHAHHGYMQRDETPKKEICIVCCHARYQNICLYSSLCDGCVSTEYF